MKFVKILTDRGIGACQEKRSRKVREVWQGRAATIDPDSVACEAETGSSDDATQQW